MSWQPDKYAYAETLVHETQHLKLSALFDLVTLTRPDDGQVYYAPWRPDPRPVSGLLQGAYAFLGVSGFWREQLTNSGSTFVEMMADVLDEWLREPVPTYALAVARCKSERHLVQWQANNGQADTG